MRREIGHRWTISKKTATESQRVTIALQEGEAAVAEVLKSALGGALGNNVEVLVAPFIKAMTGSLVKVALSPLFPQDVTDLSTALIWVTLHTETVSSRDDIGVKPRWEWELRDAEYGGARRGG